MPRATHETLALRLPTFIVDSIEQEIEAAPSDAKPSFAAVFTRRLRSAMEQIGDDVTRLRCYRFDQSAKRRDISVRKDLAMELDKLAEPIGASKHAVAYTLVVEAADRARSSHQQAA